MVFNQIKTRIKIKTGKRENVFGYLLIIITTIKSNKISLTKP